MKALPVNGHLTVIAVDGRTSFKHDVNWPTIPSWHTSLLCVGKMKEFSSKRGNYSKVGIFVVGKPSLFPCGNVPKTPCDIS